MATTYQLVATTATFNVGCSGQTAGTTTLANSASIGGTAGAGTYVIDPGNNATTACYAIELDAPNTGSWGSGNWVVNVDFSQCDADTTWVRCDLCDYEPGVGYTTVVSNGTTNHTAGGISGPYTSTLNRATEYTPTSTSNSKPFIILTFQSVALHGTSTATITETNTTVAAPYTFDIQVSSAPISFVSETQNPTTQLSTVNVTPSFVENDADTVDPTVQLSTVNVTPSFVDSDTDTVDPTVQLSTVNVNPSFLENEIGTIDPTPQLSTIQYIPDFSEINTDTMDPTVDNSIYLTAFVEVDTNTEDPTVELSSINLTPSFIEIDTSVVAPTVQLSTLNIIPSFVEINLDTVDPTTIYSSVNVIPNVIAASIMINNGNYIGGLPPIKKIRGIGSIKNIKTLRL
ncbi:MAG: hypothetical protein VW683_00560 [Betaproteobacteria bacterium]|jgi:hypothetical protein